MIVDYFKKSIERSRVFSESSFALTGQRRSMRMPTVFLTFVDAILRARFWLLAVGHAAVFAASFLIAFALRFDFHIPLQELPFLPASLLTVVGIKLVCFYLFKSFHGWWRYVAFSDLQSLAKSTVASIAVIALIDHFFLSFQIPRAVLIVDALITLVSLGIVRSSWRLLHEEIRPLFSRSKRIKSLLIGTNESTIRLGHQLRSNPQLGYDVVGLISSSVSSGNPWSSNFRILGSLGELNLVLSCYHVDEVLVPAGELSGIQMRCLADIIEKNHRKLRVIPRVEDLFSGSRKIPLRDVDINDLLGRAPVVLDNSAISSMIEGQIVLVTGAGGSIGSEICRQVLCFRPKVLIALGRGENRIFEIERELRGKLGDTRLIPVIADINDLSRLRSVFDEHQPAIVFHAAAHKHVPLMEANVCEAIRNNILGTRNVADCAHEYGVSRFVLISTDKAVNPTSVMGATKHLAERYVLSRTGESTTRFVVVRFGNVLGSNGSVIPVFQQQIRSGGPITITDERMTRFFMSIPEASQLVLQAGTQGKGGEIFVLDMGEPVAIVDLARDLIRLSGLPHDAIDIVFTGTRPGEKLYEELYFEEEMSLPTSHKKIFAAYHRSFPHDEVSTCVKAFALALQSGNSREVFLRMLAEAIPEFQHSSFKSQETEAITA